MTPSSPARRRRDRTKRARAVIDIGSNTVRMVIYEGTERAPEVIWNEKVAARLGQDLSRSGRIPEHAEAEALGALARYAVIIEDLGIEDVQTVATAAARDSQNGPQFLEKVAALGLAPRLLTGEEEACISATGAIGAFPGARGVVADLGGGSLELVSIAQGECHRASSLPFGTLRLPALRKEGHFRKQVHGALADIGWAAAHPGPLYMVGGTWRAFAAWAMQEMDYPLTDPHGFELDTAVAMEFATTLMETSAEKLAEISGISQMRAGYLPDAAALLRPLLSEFEPEGLVFSSWGLREGLLYSRLNPIERGKDPLLAGVDAFASARGAPITYAALLAGWTVDIADGRGKRNERLRLAAAQLAIALQRVEPNLRANHATEWSLDKRWIDCSARGRAMICAALMGSLGRTGMPERFRVLAGDDDLREAVGWGLGFRLARRLGAGTRISMSHSSLRKQNDELVLRLDQSRAALIHYVVERDFEMLAGWLDLEPKIKIGDYRFGDGEDENAG